MFGMLQELASSIGKVARLAARQVGPAQIALRIARVGHTAGRQRIEGQRRVADRGEVAVDVQHHIGGVGDIDADRPWRRPARWPRWP